MMHRSLHSDLVRTAHPFIFALLLGAAAFAAQPAAAQETEPTVGVQDGRFGVGFASSWPAYGISGTLQVSETITAEAVIGFLGTVSNFSGRGWYRFNRKPNYDLYGYGTAGVYRYGYSLGTENVLGLGAGVGIEAGLKRMLNDPTFPPIFINAEIGLGYADFEYYDFSSFVFGAGIHYRFGN